MSKSALNTEARTRPYKAIVTIDGVKQPAVYRVTVGGAYEGANKHLERAGYPAATVEIFQFNHRSALGEWTLIDRQVLMAGWNATF